MSTVSPHILAPATARTRAESLGARWERLLAVASVCLPIPFLAATGLSIPLPASVERIGAALVAWVDEAPEGAPLPVSGDIVLTDARQAVPEPREQVAPAARGAVAQAVGAPSASPTTGGGKGSDGGGKGSSGGSTGSTGSGGSSPPATGGSTTPPAQPGPIEETVNGVTKATEPVVDVVEDTVGGLGTTVDGLTTDLLDGGLLGGGKGAGLLGSGK
jgi:hypothetical protein